MEKLPAEILIEIFDYLDDYSMLNAMRVCKLWSAVFSSSTKLLNKFKLTINHQFFVDNNFRDLPQVPIRNITIEGINNSYGSARVEHLHAIIEKYQNSIESISILRMRYNKSLGSMLSKLQNLKYFTAVGVSFKYRSLTTSLSFPKLQSIAISKSNYRERNAETIPDLSLFKHNQSIERVELSVRTYSFDHNSLDELLKTLPKFKHLVVLGTGTSNYFDRPQFPVKLAKLEAFLLGFDWTVTRPRLEFLKSQVGSLKELKLHNLPRDYDGDVVLKFIIEEMSLESFYYGDTPLILNSKKQLVDEIWFDDGKLCAGIELLRQFPSVKKLTIRLWLNARYCHHSAPIFNQNLHPLTRLQELRLFDHSSSCRQLQKLTFLVKKCVNVKKLTVYNHGRDLSSCLHDFLPVMTQLEEMYLECDGYELYERFRIIRDSCLRLKMLKVKAEHVEKARDIFEGSQVEVGVAEVRVFKNYH